VADAELGTASHTPAPAPCTTDGALAPIKVLSDAELDQPLEESEIGDWPEPVVPAQPLTPTGYRIHEEVGRGGQACVYRATQESTGKIVAVKIMTGGSLANSRHRARFDREGRILARLEHPNIVGIIDRCRTGDGSFCLVMEYIEGPELDDYWTNCLPLDTEGTRRLIALFAKLARAIGEAHARGIIHRDLKPSNIRVDARGEPHILDFGLARGIDGTASRDLTVSGQLVGSIPWASPEQTGEGEATLDGRSDVYALGVMLYQSLTGRFPYPIDGPVRDVLSNIATVVPRPPSHEPLSRRLGKNLDTVVLKALSKRPEDRYASTAQLADDLQNVLDGKRVSAVRRRWATSYWTLTGGLLLIALAWAMISNRLPFAHEWLPHFQLPQMTDSAGIRFVRVPSGTYLMGSNITEPGHQSMEPQHSVVFSKPLYVSATEITQGQYQAVMGSDPSDPRWQGPEFPVQRVTWDEANEFCRRLSERDHCNCRLPNEKEWEYACRGGMQGPYSGARTPDPITWYADNSGGAIHPVATKESNAWGIFDTHGNVAEWCADVFDPSGDRANGLILRIVKGGSALDPANNCRSAFHLGLAPDTRRSDLGFRVVIDVDSISGPKQAPATAPTSPPH